MKVEKTSLEGVLLIKPEPASAGQGELSEDLRGAFLETYNEAKYNAQGITTRFLEDDLSISKKDVVRGLHGNSVTWKLISCLHGEVFFVVVNCNKESAEFGKWESFDLNETNHWQVLVPPMYGCGLATLSDKIILQYKQSAYYDAKSQFTYRWDEPKFGIKWPVANPILTPRDAGAKFIDDMNAQ